MATDGSLILPLPSATLVFGLEWLPLLGGKPERIGLSLARRHRATYMVLAGESAGSVGIAALKAGRARRKQRLYSAAQNVAQLFPTGTIAMLLELEQAGCWLVAVHEGAVVARTDRLYRCRDDAQPGLVELRRAYPQLVLLGSLQAPEPPSLAAIEAASSSHGRLQPLTRWTPLLPWPVQGFALALVLMLLMPRLGQVFSPGSDAPAVAMNTSPQQAWQAAIEKANRDRVVHGVRGTRAVLDALYDVPVRVSGWFLQQVECAAQIQQWRCQARYERRDTQANNSQFLAGVPESWAVEFISMDLAQSVWKVSGHGTELLAQQLKTSSHNERELFSALQAIRPAFSQVQIGKPAPLPVPVPNDERGQPLPRPSGLAIYSSRSVQVSGPLRSGSLLLPHTSSIQWNKAVLGLHNIEQPGLKISGLNLSLQGVLYEIDANYDEQRRVAPEVSIVAAQH